MDAFQVKTLHPTLLLSVYLGAARGFLALGEEDTALDLLEAYTDLATGDIYPCASTEMPFFDQLDRWMEDTLTLGRDLPRTRPCAQEHDPGSHRPSRLRPSGRPLPVPSLVGRLRANEEVAP